MGYNIEIKQLKAVRLPAGRKTRLRVAFLMGEACQKCFCVTFNESNKAEARKPRFAPISGADLIKEKED